MSKIVITFVHELVLLRVKKKKKIICAGAK